MKFNRSFLIFLVLGLVVEACSSARLPATDILFADDFSNTKNKWDQVSNNSIISNYFNDAYQMASNEVDSQVWANPKDKSYTDTSVEVDATKNGGPDDNDFGIICRYKGKDSFYYGVISCDGYYAISKMTPTGGKPIGNTRMLQSDKIATGPAINHIRFDCIGSTLTLYANGYQLAQGTDTDYSSGNVGLIIGTFKDPGTDILFDNFLVYKP